MRNLKTMGLAFVAMLALGAVYASAASAQQGMVTSDGPFTLTGEDTGPESANQFTAFGASIRCPGSTYTGHPVTTYEETTEHQQTTATEGKPAHSGFLPSGSTEATITPHYKQTVGGEPNCSAPGLGWSATVHMNGCDFDVTIGNTTESTEEVATYGATFDVECPPDHEIVVTFWKTVTKHKSGTQPHCVIRIPQQTGLTGAHVTDTDSNDGHIELTGKATGIKATKENTGHDSSILCLGSETREDGTYDLDVTVEAHDSSETPKETEISLSHN